MTGQGSSGLRGFESLAAAARSRISANQIMSQEAVMGRRRCARDSSSLRLVIQPLTPSLLEDGAALNGFSANISELGMAILTVRPVVSCFVRIGLADEDTVTCVGRVVHTGKSDQDESVFLTGVEYVESI